MKSGVFSGLVGLDIVYYQDNIPDENKKSKTNDYKTFIGGPVANAAITFSILGGKATVVTCIGDSLIGKTLKNQLSDEYGISVIDLVDNEEILPCISSIIISPNGSRTIFSGQQNFEPKLSCDLDIIKNSLFCFSDCNLQQVSKNIIKTASSLGKKIILDTGSWKNEIEEYLSCADEVIASNDCVSPNGEGMFSVSKKYGVKCVAVTNGERPIKWQVSSNSGEISPLKVEVYDTLGAGDVFHGAFCYFREAKQYSFEKALKEASVVASYSVKYSGIKKGILEYKNKFLV